MLSLELYAQPLSYADFCWGQRPYSKLSQWIKWRLEPLPGVVVNPSATALLHGTDAHKGVQCHLFIVQKNPSQLHYKYVATQRMKKTELNFFFIMNENVCIQVLKSHFYFAKRMR